MHESNGHHYTAAYGSSPRTGYHLEGPTGWIAKRAYPNTKKLYSCRETGTADFFTSVDQSGGCEGQTSLGSLGYIFTKPPTDGYRILYRCNRGASHFDSLSASCEGETVEGGHGYVLP